MQKKIFLFMVLFVSFFSMNVSAGKIPKRWNVTYYETKENQTDNTPCIGVRNINLCLTQENHPKIRLAAVSRKYYWKLQNYLFNVICPDDIKYRNVLFLDKTNSRIKITIDILDNGISKGERRPFAFKKRECTLKKVEKEKLPYAVIMVDVIHWRTGKPSKRKIKLKN